ncbi:MAG TPA: zf-HC2 domain-containing protein [Gammaproteobacteria bacterium]|nr:zf-HC2 domain-containing protein [Gammaproteobacteria bacterium]
MRLPEPDSTVRSPRSEYAARHAAVFELLPWYVNGTLAAAERARVLAHLEGCLSCRRELELLEALQRALRAPASERRCEDALRRLHARMATREKTSPPWAAAAVLALVVGLVSTLSGNTEASVAWLKNTGLSMMSQSHVADSSTESVRAHLVFYDNITERQLRALLLSVGADLIEGPTPQGVYTVAFTHTADPEEIRRVLSELRHSRRVIYAEPLMPKSVADW